MRVPRAARSAILSLPTGALQGAAIREDAFMRRDSSSAPLPPAVCAAATVAIPHLKTLQWSATPPSGPRGPGKVRAQCSRPARDAR